MKPTVGFATLLTLCTSVGAAGAQSAPLVAFIDSGERETLLPNYEAVAKECTRIIESTKTSVEVRTAARRRRAYAYLNQHAHRQVLDDANELCRQAPTDVEARCLRTLALAGIGEIDTAVSQATECVKLAPNQPRVHTVLGSVFCLRHDWRKAADCARQALKCDKHYAGALLLDAWAAYNVMEFAECATALTKYFERGAYFSSAPDFPFALRGMAVLQLGRPNEALGNLLTAQHLNRSAAQYARGIATAYEWLGRLDLAAIAHESVMHLEPDRYDELKSAWLYARIGKADLALRALARFDSVWTLERLDTKPQANTLGCYGRMRLYLGDPKGASVAFDKALALDANCSSALFGKAEMLCSYPDRKHRSGNEALNLVKRLLRVEETTRLPEQRRVALYQLFGDVLAETAEFEAALQYVRMAKRVAEPEHAQGEFDARIRLFENKRAFRLLLVDLPKAARPAGPTPEPPPNWPNVEPQMGVQ